MIKILLYFAALLPISASAALPEGIVGDGKTDCTAAFRKAVQNGGKIRLPRGIYVVRDTIKIGDGVSVIGEKGTVIRLDGTNHVFEATGALNGKTLLPVRNLTFRNLSFVSYTKRDKMRPVYAIIAHAVGGLRAEGLATYGLGGVKVDTVYPIDIWRIPKGQTDPQAIAGMDNHDSLSRDIRITSCHFDGQFRDERSCGVDIRFVRDFTVSNVVARLYDSGVQYWGGDSSHKRGGHPTTPRRCHDGLIADCVIEDVRSGGIWGSMGENLRVVRCTTRRCDDVGIDFEGGHNCMAVDCLSEDCKNGNYSTFMYCCRDIVFKNCTSRLSARSGALCHYFHSNSTQRALDQRVAFRNCTFESELPGGEVRPMCGMKLFEFRGNTCKNVILAPPVNNVRKVIDEGNRYTNL